MSYKVTGGNTAADALQSQAFTIPGRLVGVAVDIGATAMSIQVQMLSPGVGWADVQYNDILAGATSATGTRIFLFSGFPVIGSHQYRIVYGLPESRVKQTQWYYEDMPSLY